MHRALVVTLALVLSTPSALAASDSLFTVGLGTALGVSHADTAGALAEPVTELSLKLKALHVLGLEPTYAPTEHGQAGDSIALDGALNLSALLYVVPTYPVGFYVKAGLGANTLGDLFAYDGESTSYHFGAGLDVYLGDHVVIGLEYLMLAPGVASVESDLHRRAEVATERLRARDAAAAADVAVPGIGDYLSPTNFRATVSARWYF